MKHGNVKHGPMSHYAIGNFELRKKNTENILGLINKVTRVEVARGTLHNSLATFLCEILDYLYKINHPPKL